MVSQRALGAAAGVLTPALSTFFFAEKCLWYRLKLPTGTKGLPLLPGDFSTRYQKEFSFSLFPHLVLY